MMKAYFFDLNKFGLNQRHLGDMDLVDLGFMLLAFGGLIYELDWVGFYCGFLEFIYGLKQFLGFIYGLKWILSFMGFRLEFVCRLDQEIYSYVDWT